MWKLRARLAIIGGGQLTGGGGVVLSMLENDPRKQVKHSVFNHQVGEWLLRKQRKRVEQEFTLTPQPISLGPAPPGSVIFTGLLGDWRIKAEFDRQKARAGEIVELNIQAQGRGDPYRWRQPELNLNGFAKLDSGVEAERLSPEESRVTARWRLIPVHPEARLKMPAWYTFDSVKESYRKHLLAPELKISPATPAATKELPGKEVLTAHKLNYLHTQWSEEMKRPWWRHGLGLTVLFLLAGLAGLTGALKINRQHRWRNILGEKGCRHQQALKQKNKLLRSLRSVNSEQFVRRMKEEAVPWLIDFLGLPPGTTSEELAHALETIDTELATMVQVLDRVEYEPRLKSWLDQRQAICSLRRLAGLAVLFLVFLGAMSFFLRTTARSGELGANLDELSPEATFQKAVEAYSEREYQQAEQLFASLERPDRINPALLYNQANCAWLRREQWRALALFERARRASPRNHKVRNNLAIARKELGLPPITGEETDWRQRVISQRDYLRPDEWLRLATLFFAVPSLALWRRERAGASSKLARRWCLAGTLLVLVPVLALITQLMTVYRPLGQAAVIREASLKSAPAGAAATIKALQGPWREVNIKERRPSWVRVEVDGRTGWVRQNKIMPFWEEVPGFYE